MAESNSGPGDTGGESQPAEQKVGEVPTGLVRRREARPPPTSDSENGAAVEPPEAKKGPIVERKGGGAFLPPPPRIRPPKPVAPKPEPLFRKPQEAKPMEPPPAPRMEEPLETESFAQLFASSASQRGNRVEPGQKVTGRILQFGRETTFLDLGSAAGIKTEALIDTRELRDENGELRFQIGAELTGYVKSLEDGVWITTALPKGAQREALFAARETGMPVEGTVIGVNKGGLEVDLGSGIRGFVPASQASARFTPDLAGMVGQKLQFLVTQVKDRDIVLSRRGLLEREGKEKAEALRDTLIPGLQLEGTVTSLREFGAFVDLGGIEGLVPMAELSHRRIGHPEEILKVGQLVTVEILRVEPQAKTGEGRERITLSLKKLEDDPWMVFGNAIVEGQRFKGKVVRLQPFGAFVELSPGVDGLVHVSRLVGASGGRVTHPEEVLKTGQEVWVEVETLDRASRKIGLRTLSDAEAALPPGPRVGPPRIGDVLEAIVDKVESFGLFVRFPGGRGLLPGAELGTPRGADLRRSHPPGTKIKAQVIDIDTQGRIRLSATAAVLAEERAQVDAYQKEHQQAGKGFGTLADLLKGKRS